MAERKPKTETVEPEAAEQPKTETVEPEAAEQPKTDADPKPGPVTRLQAWPKPIVRQRPEA